MDIHGNREDCSSASRAISATFGTYGGHVGCHGDQEMGNGEGLMVDACLDEVGVAYEERRKG